MPHQCSFCDQRVISETKLPPTPQTVSKTCAEAYTAFSVARRQNTEIAFFGGSFTAIDPATMIAYLEAAAPFCKKDGFSGIRISTRPDAITDEILQILQRYGVTAIELGVQSLDDTVLALNKRGHTVADVEQAVRAIHQYGFSLGLQMMTGLYGDSKESVYKTAEQIVSFHPDTVRIYPTVVLRNTQLGRLYQAGVYTPFDLDESVALAADLILLFEQAGIRVIRVGLHASAELEQNYLAGGYHPAFRELCEGEIFYRILDAKLKSCGLTRAQVAVSPQAVSKLVGQNRCNLRRLEQNGYRITVTTDSRLTGRTIMIKEV